MNEPRRTHRRFQHPALRALGLMLLCGPSVFTGCSHAAKPNGPDGRAVSGTVLYQGQPVAGATVTFKSASHSAVAATDDKGRFNLVAAGRGDSVPLGTYTVTVSKLEQPVLADPTGDAQYQIPAPNAARPAPPKNLLPDRYNTDASGLTANVTADGKNDFNFELSG